MSALLARGTEPKSVDGVFGFLLLRANGADDVAICRSFFKFFRPVQSATASSVYIVRPTYWLDARKVEQIPLINTCQNLVKAYDYDRASVELNAMGLANSAGPVLVAHYATGKKAMHLNASGIRSQGDLEFVLREWNAIIVDDPQNWSSAWAANPIVQFRIVLTNFTPVILSLLPIPKPAWAAVTPVMSLPNEISSAIGSETDPDKVVMSPLLQ